MRINTFGQSLATGVPYNFLNSCLIYFSSSQEVNTSVPRVVWAVLNIQFF